MLLFAWERVGRALRQLQRLQMSHHAYRTVEALADAPRMLTLDDPLRGLHEQWLDDCYFATVAIWQALAARQLANAGGFALPAVRDHKAWKRLRDMEEHWANEAAGEELRARLAWDEQGGSQMPRRHFEVDREGARVTALSGLSLAAVEEDLLAVLFELRQHMETHSQATGSD